MAWCLLKTEWASVCLLIPNAERGSVNTVVLLVSIK